MNISELESRLAALEATLKRKQPGRRKGGYTTQRGAAEYLGRSREWLRRLQLEGKGPKRSANGQYAFDDLDAYMRGEDSA